MASEKTPVVWDDDAKKHRPLGSGEKMGGLSASSMISSDSGNLLQQGSDGLMLVTGSSLADPRADNLLEESGSGKLQVTSDRIVEWLDGHPQAAAAIADAVKVVSGDDGNVIVQGTDKGAYLPKQAISAAVSAMTDAQKNQLADAISPRIAADIADGQTVTASGGKLHFDPTNATAAQKKAINQALADQTSGLVVNSSTGRLGVDFSNMPTDKFEALLKGLKMKVPLSANMNVYVSITNSAAGDDIVDGRGTAAKPFKHIQAAVNYITSTYSLGGYGVNILVVAGTYPENITLPDYDRGTGAIAILPASGARDVVIDAQPLGHGGAGVNVSALGGTWVLQSLDLRRTERPTLSATFTGGCVHAIGAGTQVYMRGCSVTQTAPAGGATGGNEFGCRLLYADSGARIILRASGLAGSITAVQPSDSQGAALGYPSTTVIDLRRGGSMLLYRDPNDALHHDIDCYGAFDCFLLVSQGSSVNTGGTGPLVSFTDHNTNGKKYRVYQGSYVAGTGSQDYFPGDEAGSLDTTTYCWYS